MAKKIRCYFTKIKNKKLCSTKGCFGLNHALNQSKCQVEQQKMNQTGDKLHGTLIVRTEWKNLDWCYNRSPSIGPATPRLNAHYCGSRCGTYRPETNRGWICGTRDPRENKSLFPTFRRTSRPGYIWFVSIRFNFCLEFCIYAVSSKIRDVDHYNYQLLLDMCC